MQYQFGAYNNPIGLPVVQYKPIGKSISIPMMVPVVLTTYTTWTTSSQPVLRLLTTADTLTATGHYYTCDHSTGVVAGIAGFAAVPAYSDAYGVANVQDQPTLTGILAASVPILTTPSMPYTLEPDPLNGFSLVPVIDPGKGNIFVGTPSHTGVAMTAAQKAGLVSGLAGFYVSSGVFTVDLDANTLATGGILSIVKYDKDNNLVHFTVNPLYNQLSNGVAYTAA
jgi:hypothetical protein